MRRIGITLLLFLASTWRIKAHGIQSPEPKVIAFWHGVMLPVWYYHRKVSHKVAVVSKSRDGQILSSILRKLKYTLVRGSSSTDGKVVLERATNLASSHRVLITPDGPRGPHKKMKIGAILIASRANVPFQHCKVKCKYAINLKSWDKFTVPLPFAKVHLHFSDPVMIENTDDREKTRQLMKQIETEMNKR